MSFSQIRQNCRFATEVCSKVNVDFYIILLRSTTVGDTSGKPFVVSYLRFTSKDYGPNVSYRVLLVGTENVTVSTTSP